MSRLRVNFLNHTAQVCIAQHYGISTLSVQYRKAKSAYNRIFRSLLNVSREDMINSMVRLGVRSFPEIMRSQIYGFSKRIWSCENKINTGIYRIHVLLHQ